MTKSALETEANRIGEPIEMVAPLSSAPSLADIDATRVALRDASRKPIAPSRIADAIARAISLWRDRQHPRRVDAVARITRNAGFSLPLMNDSIDALLRPFTREALATLAERVTRRGARKQAELLGFIMAGNVAGAGLHEVAIALVAGATLLVKTASNEPIFFAEFVRTLADIDPEVASRIAVFSWPRDRIDLTAAHVANCDLIVAYGDDATIASIAARNLIGFGSRVSGAVVAGSAAISSQIDTMTDLLARDVAYFEQLGCLSPHHIFVVTPRPEIASKFANEMSVAFERLSKSMPPAKIPLIDAAKILSVRENARWRRISGDTIQLMEGPQLGWTAIFDPDAAFSVSPGFRTVVISAVRDWQDLRFRLLPAKGLIEAFGFSGNQSELADFRALAGELGISYVAQVGEMQSPPLDWPHGGGAFLDAMIGVR
ncbi:MAG: acyl-CoA reductase [Candidatus Binatus sp.]|uniref:acyl-CoA reductase n=1 Tax=Candidatus Binatus sp. TaxID=2811406 RepID=UPI00272279EB|nr:acyl-CoA reductase [Candidatus Binatus sp.]MDO8435001.1 acyl-CoA reductase [Candidatus Binatus sp.]